MKLDRVLIFLIFNSILWSLINSVKNNKNQNELTRVVETSEGQTKNLNDGDEFSVVPQVHQYKGKFNSETKMSNNETSADIYEEKKLKKKEYMKNYYQNNKEKHHTRTK
uniref:Uncharacterized protein n=1 Tax=Meloidogyne enterolobii TaxID=390850 RepID=A0A6V7V8U3_MELEN|nr:unnamed protein product [Meloidogyne enterolobii]